MRWMFVLLCLPGAAMGQDQFTTVLGHSVAVQKISSAIVAEREENLLASVADVLQKHSQDTGHEACAQICKSSNQYGAVVTTVGSHIMCPVTNLCPEGFTPTNVGIHSHPGGHSYKINPVDKILLNSPFYKVGATEKRGKNNAFSEEDFAAGPGYMVNVQGEIFYQEGPKKVRKIR